MNKRMMVSTILFVSLAFMAVSSVASAMKQETCEKKGPFLILEDQTYALCATADCFMYNQVLYCDCDIMKGDSISLPLDFDNENICDVNEQGKTNGCMVSTFSVPRDTVYPHGKMASYTCPGEANKGNGFAAIGSYGQCDGGICFTSTTGKTFPGFDNRLINQVICACPVSTNCDPTSRNRNGYQISGEYPGRCDPEACNMCSAGELSRLQGDCLANPVANIPQGTIIPVGAPTGTGKTLSCALLDGDVPPLNSCLCQCLRKDHNGNCIWTVIDESPLIADCKN